MFAGVVPAPVFTTVMQVASRLFLMWAVCWPFPQLNASPFYSSMLCAWSLTEVIRYSYFALKQVEAVPGWLHWLRYSAFLVLYPVGISSEVAMTLQALFGPASALVAWYPYALGAVLLSYIPGEYILECPALGLCDGTWADSVCAGSFILYTHMLKQRKKYLGAGKTAEKKTR
jgi:very-long-chain (3R)-3-hydroxyacyl-CoA dehydratase